MEVRGRAGSEQAPKFGGFREVQRFQSLAGSKPNSLRVNSCKESGHCAQAVGIAGEKPSEKSTVAQPLSQPLTTSVADDSDWTLRLWPYGY